MPASPEIVTRQETSNGNGYRERTLRRITWRIVPFIMLLYFVAHIDRVNIGLLAALTMKEDHGLHPFESFVPASSGVFPVWKCRPTSSCTRSALSSGSPA